MKKWWQEFPFIRMIVPFVAGILVYRTWPVIPFSIISGLFGMLLLCLWGFEKLTYYTRFARAYFRGIALHGLLFLSGLLLCRLHDIRIAPKWYKNKLDSYPYAVLELQEDVVHKEKTEKAEAAVLMMVHSTRCEEVCGQVVVYFKKNNRSRGLQAGDRVLVPCRFHDVKPNTNPGGFDYRAYCSDRSITQSIYLRDTEWKRMKQKSGALSLRFYSMARRLRGILAERIRDPSSRGIAEALLMGYRGNIDDDTWMAYSRAGIVHIIAISGMHMAMIYQSFLWLLLRIPFFRKRQGVPVLLAMSGMWIFAALTGLPPSVGRAAWMFTFIGMGSLFQKRIGGLNNLLVSAFMLLCLHPAWIADIGFQLSYLAVLSLLVFYRPFYQLIYVSPSWLDKLWQLMSATMAAQVLTFPLCIYYFRQFPVLFLFSNMVAVPASTCILYAEILLVSISWLPCPSLMLGKVISACIRQLNVLVDWFNALPFACLGDLHLDRIQVLCCYGLVLFSARWLMQRKMGAVSGILACVLVWIVNRALDEYIILRRNTMIVYDIPKQQALEFHSGHLAYSPDAHTLRQDAKAMSYVLEPAHMDLATRHLDPDIVRYAEKPGVECYQFNGRHVLRLSSAGLSAMKAIHTDYLIISRDAWPVDMIRSGRLSAGRIILDASIPIWKATKIKEALKEYPVPVHAVAVQGAFVQRF